MDDITWSANFHGTRPGSRYAAVTTDVKTRPGSAAVGDAALIEAQARPAAVSGVADDPEMSTSAGVASAAVSGAADDPETSAGVPSAAVSGGAEDPETSTLAVVASAAVSGAPDDPETSTLAVVAVASAHDSKAGRPGAAAHDRPGLDAKAGTVIHLMSPVCVGPTVDGF